MVRKSDLEFMYISIKSLSDLQILIKGISLRGVGYELPLFRNGIVSLSYHAVTFIG